MSQGKYANVVVVMGVSGSGKSSIGKALADQLGYQFVEGDDFHSEDNKQRMANQVPLTDAMREPWVKAIYEYLFTETKNGENVVLSFSGLRKQHRDQLRQLPVDVHFLFLSGDFHLIKQRMQQRQNHFMPISLLESQFHCLQSPTHEPKTYTVSIADDFEMVLDRCLSNIRSALNNKKAQSDN